MQRKLFLHLLPHVYHVIFDELIKETGSHIIVPKYHIVIDQVTA